MCVEINQHSNRAKCQSAHRAPSAPALFWPCVGNLDTVGGWARPWPWVSRIVMVQRLCFTPIVVTVGINRLSSPRLAPHGGRRSEQSVCELNDRFFVGERTPPRGHPTTLTWQCSTRHGASGCCVGLVRGRQHPSQLKSSCGTVIMIDTSHSPLEHASPLADNIKTERSSGQHTTDSHDYLQRAHRVAVCKSARSRLGI